MFRPELLIAARVCRGVIRNLAATPDGRVYLACSGVNKVGVAAVAH
jgi:hypothetical protein